MSDGKFAPLLASGVKHRCACGTESTYQREAKLPPFWSLDWYVIDGRSWPIYRCAQCAEERARGRGVTTPREREREARREKKNRRKGS